jgi:hypothetical protein
MQEATFMRAYLADPGKAAETLRDKLEETFLQHSLGAGDAKPGGGKSEPSRSSATITFQLSPEAIAEDRERQYFFYGSPRRRGKWKASVQPLHRSLRLRSSDQFPIAPNQISCLEPCRNCAILKSSRNRFSETPISTAH